MKAIENITIRFVYPPIPDRNFDYEATRTSYEPGWPIGRGRTPVVALAELLLQEEEADDQEPFRNGPDTSF